MHQQPMGYEYEPAAALATLRNVDSLLPLLFASCRMSLLHVGALRTLVFRVYRR